MLAFQTRNPLHRAHEYALVYGAEQLTREGKYAGVALNPLVGQLKGDDVNAEMRMKTYVNLVKHRLLGKGDSDTALWEKVGYDINDVFHLIGLDMRMLYGGPSEAVMHAIYRQNSGFSHIVIGRKHAGRAVRRQDRHLGRLRRAGDLQEPAGRAPHEARQRRLRSVLRVDQPRRPHGEPQGREAVRDLGTGVRDALVAGQRPGSADHAARDGDTLIEAYKK
jgi:hypothetical protein